MSMNTLDRCNDLIAENTRLEQERDSLAEDYQRCCETIARMHLAAMGETTGPVIGVVEDVANIRKERDELAAQVEVMRLALENARSWHRCDEWRDCDDESNRDAWQMQMNRIDDALALPNTAATILRQRDAGIDQCAECRSIAPSTDANCRKCNAATPAFTEAVNAFMKTAPSGKEETK